MSVPIWLVLPRCEAAKLGVLVSNSPPELHEILSRFMAVVVSTVSGISAPEKNV